MRIIGGKLKGRVLKGPDSAAIRPTSDRLRETIFNILIHAYGDPIAGARVLDLFAGAGALGLEALSRGARFAVMVDNSAKAAALIAANAAALGLSETLRILRRDARRLGDAPGEGFSLAFLDPPYGKNLAAPALAALREGGWLAANALAVIEEAAQAELILPDGFAALETRRYGETQLIFARFIAGGQVDASSRA